MVLVLIVTTLIASFLLRKLWKDGILFLDPLYVAIRNNGDPSVGAISKGLLRQVIRPWRRGIGVEFKYGKYGKYVLHIGVCWRRRAADPSQALLASLDGRWLEDDPEVIQKWIK